MSQSLLKDPGYPDLKQYVLESTGLAYYADKDDDLAGRIHRRMQQMGSGDCRSYLSILSEESKTSAVDG